MPHPNCFFTSIMDKTHHKPVIALFFCETSASFLAYVGGVLGTNLFHSLLMINKYLLAIQQIRTHEEYLRYTFRSVAIFWTASEVLAP